MVDSASGDCTLLFISIVTVSTLLLFRLESLILKSKLSYPVYSVLDI